MGKMLAAVLRGPGKMQIEELPDPEMPQGGALLKVEACAVCGTDIKMQQQGHRDLIYPCIPGHELVGRIVHLDGDNSGYYYHDNNKGPIRPILEGDLVAVWPGIACGRCPSCRRGFDHRCLDIKIMGFNFPGGFAEMCALPAESLSSGLNPLPEGFDPALAALSEPLGCCINGKEQVGLTEGDSVLILGGGPIGALHALLAEACGTAKIIVAEKLASRISALKCNTHATVFNPDEEDTADIVAAETDGLGVDAIFSAAPQVNLDAGLLHLLSPGGRACVFSGPAADSANPPMDLRLIHYRELSICGAYGCSSRHTRMAAELLTSERIRADWLITKRASLAQIGESFAHSSAREGMKSVVCKR